LFFGQIGIKEYEYYTNSSYTNFCILEGWLENQQHFIEVIRFATYRLHQTFLGKKSLSINKFWTIEEQGNNDKLIATEELWAKIKQRYPSIK
jgi:hypothetical protein